MLAGGRPSSEVGFHAGVLRARPEPGVVLHFHTPCATALACRKPDGLDDAVIPEIPYYVGSAAHVPYFLPGSDELAVAVTEALPNHDLALTANHGQVTVGRDCDAVVSNAEFFELACQILQIGGGTAAPMPPTAAAQLRALRHKGRPHAC